MAVLLMIVPALYGQANLPSGTTASGTINYRTIAAPSTPASGRLLTWTDSSSKIFCGVNDAGNSACTAFPFTAASHQFVNSLSGGVFGTAQPAFSDISGTLGCSQLFAITGDVSNSLCAFTVTALHLSPTPTLCGAGNYSRGIDANGNATGCTSATVGVVTSIATTSPITGGTITGTGTIACATCVTASSPGVGIAHFAGSTQAVTSSAVNLASADVTGITPIANGGTGQSSFSAGLLRSSGTALSSSELSGDATTSGSNAVTLASVVTAGSCGDTTHSCGLTYDVKGRLRAATNNAISGGGGSLASLNELSQTAALGATTLYAVPSLSSGLYRISWSNKLSVAGGGGVGTFAHSMGAASNFQSFGSNTAAGNFIACSNRWFSGTLTNLTDTDGNTYHAAGSVFTDASSNNVQLWYAYNITGDTGGTRDTVTAHYSGASFTYIVCAEYSGILNTSDPLDQTAGTSGNGNAPASGNITTIQGNETIIGFANSSSGATWTAGTGYTQRASAAGTAIEDKTLTSAGTTSASFSTSSSGNWSMGVASFKSQSGSPSSSVQVSVSWTDADDSTSMSFTGAALNANTLTALDQEQLIVNAKASTNISVSASYSSTSSPSASYNLHFTAAQP